MSQSYLQCTVALTVQRYVHNIFQPHVLPLFVGGAIFQQNNVRPHIERVSQKCLHFTSTFTCSIPLSDLSPLEHLWDPLGGQVRQPTSLSELKANCGTRCHSMPDCITV
ncbi:transposable element Tcb2 transposase [Trichonephila clavipes]|uniref:Transposable element Tcb2 transposase n=1 Tax=Trichonephila clavipes TaxID=2585209 RepID=A0A8X6SBT0_TRICX|nr:transposable element Tcb2 transposase [Trichonephila clavipes]